MNTMWSKYAKDVHNDSPGGHYNHAERLTDQLAKENGCLSVVNGTPRVGNETTVLNKGILGLEVQCKDETVHAILNEAGPKISKP